MGRGSSSGRVIQGAAAGSRCRAGGGGKAGTCSSRGLPAELQGRLGGCARGWGWGGQGGHGGAVSTRTLVKACRVMTSGACHRGLLATTEVEAMAGPSLRRERLKSVTCRGGVWVWGGWGGCGEGQSAVAAVWLHHGTREGRGGQGGGGEEEGLAPHPHSDVPPALISFHHPALAPLISSACPLAGWGI